MRRTAELSEVPEVMAWCWLLAPEWTRKPGAETRNNKTNWQFYEINYFVLLHDFSLCCIFLYEKHLYVCVFESQSCDSSFVVFRIHVINNMFKAPRRMRGANGNMKEVILPDTTWHATRKWQKEFSRHATFIINIKNVKDPFLLLLSQKVVF